jgi:hypothetical protein
VRLCYAIAAGLLEEGLNRFAAGLAAGTPLEGTPPGG